MPGWPETRDTLLARLRDPDDLQAWSEFSTLYHPLIFRFALRRGLQEADALDITQQVLWAVARAAESWTSVEGKPRFRSWLATVARNATLNLLQRDGKNRASGKSSVWEFMKTIPAPDEDLETSWTTERRKQIFRQAAQKTEPLFSPAIWQLFWRTTVEGESIEAVASELGKSLGAAYAGRSRVMAHLRREAQLLDQADSGVDSNHFSRERDRHDLA